MIPAHIIEEIGIQMATTFHSRELTHGLISSAA
jgi:hypothetical protein